MELTVSSETSAIRTQTPGNYPKKKTLHLEHSESLETRKPYVVMNQTRMIPAAFGKTGTCHYFREV